MNEIIVGYSNTYHDPALAFIDGERVFAVTLERPAQDKRACWQVGVADILIQRVRTAAMFRNISA